MIKSAIEYISELALASRTNVRSVARLPDGRDFFTDTGSLIDPQEFPSINFSTLSGLAGYINANRDQATLKDCMVHIVNHNNVQFYGQAVSPYFERRFYATSTIKACNPHKFGQYLDAESFVIWLLSGFVQDEQTASILKIVGNLKAEKVTSLTDDGVTQVAGVRAGVSRISEVEIRNPIWLKPYRTFEEIDQPGSPFVLRLQEKEGGLPRIALFESCDISWINTAMVNIKELLCDLINDKTIPVLA